MKRKGFKLTIKAPKVRATTGPLAKAARVFRSGKIYNRKAGKRVEQ